MIYNILDYLEKGVARHPDKTLFADPVNSITYKNCEKVSRAIGTAIARAGAPHRPVAVLIDRDIESLEIFMGAVYAGNFYVPIGKTLPPGRISMILETVKPVCLVCREKDKEFVNRLNIGVKILIYEEIIHTVPDSETLNKLRRTHIDTDPLYAIYTSGSTGTPKGVLVCHRSVIDLVDRFTECFGFGENEVFGNQAPFDFDVSVKDIYSTLRNGATMYVVPQKMFSFPKLLIPYLNENKITTVIWAVSALALVATFKGMEKEIPHHLKKVMFSGEVMPIKVLNYWKEKIPDAMYVNLYGPTEITCNCSYYIVDREFSLNEILPIGQPFPNTDMFLLDENNKIPEDDKLGEICVRGTSLALGYYRNKEATEKAFCQNPLNPDYPELIYRTGDLGKYHNGEIFYVTRKDFQIKHMGHRIELGEIESVLDGLEYISRSCCIYDGDNEKIYMFYQAKEQCDRQIVKDMQIYLPKYMCPNKYVYLEQLPLNKNGKIDRNLLKERYIINGNH